MENSCDTKQRSSFSLPPNHQLDPWNASFLLPRSIHSVKQTPKTQRVSTTSTNHGFDWHEEMRTLTHTHRRNVFVQTVGRFHTWGIRSRMCRKGLNSHIRLGNRIGSPPTSTAAAGGDAVRKSSQLAEEHALSHLVFLTFWPSASGAGERRSASVNIT